MQFEDKHSARLGGIDNELTLSLSKRTTGIVDGSPVWVAAHAIRLAPSSIGSLSFNAVVNGWLQGLTPQPQDLNDLKKAYLRYKG